MSPVLFLYAAPKFPFQESQLEQLAILFHSLLGPREPAQDKEQVDMLERTHVLIWKHNWTI